MKTYTSPGANFKADVQTEGNGTADFGYLGSSSAIKIYLNTGITAATYIYTFGGSYEPAGALSSTPLTSVDYISAPDGTLRVSLRKFLDMAGPGGTLYLQITATFGGVADTMGITLHAVKGVSYNDLALPRGNELHGFTYADHAVVPPNIMLNSDWFTGIIAESSLANVAIPVAHRPVGVWQNQAPGGSPVTITPAGDRLNQLAIGGKATLLTYTETIGGNSIAHTWELQQVDDCTDIVMLRWTSQTGAIRKHIFRVVNLQADVEAAAQLFSNGDGYNVTKNTSRGFKVRIDGLTPSSWWYYADMVLASDLHAALPEQAAELETEFCAAYCVDPQMVMPSGNSFTSFEATIKRRHYDTF